MKYFKDLTSGEVFAYDENDETQIPFMQAKIEAGLTDITESWTPPEFVILEPVKPSIQDLQAQLALIQAQIALLLNE